MPEPPADDRPGFVADEPEQCHDSNRLIQPGDACQLTIDSSVLCSYRIRSSDAIRLSGGLTVEVGEDRLPVPVDEEGREIRSEPWRSGSELSLERSVVLTVRAFARSRWAETRRIRLPLIRAIVADGVPVTHESAPAGFPG